MAEESARLTLDGATYDLPIVRGTEGDKAIDIRQLRSITGQWVTLDPGFANTASCTSSITYLNGEQAILRYRGIPIEEMAEHASFLETAYLLIYGKLPNSHELDAFSRRFTLHAPLPQEMLAFFDGYPRPVPCPMAVLSSMVVSLSAFYPELIKPDPSDEEFDTMVAQLMSKVRTICAHSYKISIGETVIPPRDDLPYIPNFLHMMFSKPGRDYPMREEVVDAMRVLLVLHADHEQNCSTSTVRLVGSSWANLFASVSAGVCALWGPLHGGANQKVIEMLEMIQQDGGDVKKYVAMAKDPNKKFRLMGFGHRVYKNYDPRAKIIKRKADEVLNVLGIHDPLLDLAKQLEEIALQDDYFIERKLYPNVDFYSGIIYRAIGIPTNMFPVMFAIGRLPGWIAHWKEMRESPETKIGRPRQVYMGPTRRSYLPMEQRG